MPKISVIMPVYNAEKVVGRAIDSVLDQTYEDFELIIVNDGSKDKSGKICSEYALKDSRIKYINKENQGVAIARNIALEASTGEKIAFVDADDCVCKDFLEKMIRVMTENNAQIAICNYDRFCKDLPNENEVAEKIMVWNHNEGLKNCYGYYGAKVGGILWNKIYDAELFQCITFPDGLKNEDEFVLPKLIDKCSKIVVTNEILYHYYENSNSITNDANYYSSMDIFRVFDDRLKYFEAKGSEYDYFVKLTKKEYLDRIIARYKKTKSEELKDLYSKKFYEYKGSVASIGYKIFKFSPDLYYFIVNLKEK